MSPDAARSLVADAVSASGMSTAEALCHAIRQAIIVGDYGAGQRVTEDRLAAEFATSRTSVREALRVLSAEGFVEIRPYFGVFIASMSPAEATELLEFQAELEAMAAGLAATRRAPADVTELRQIVAEGRAAVAAGQPSTSAALHGRFHHVLTRAANNRSLAAVMTQLRYKVDWVYATKVRRPAGDSWDEHSDIVDAIAAQSVEAAVRTAREHVRRGSLAQLPHEPR